MYIRDRIVYIAHVGDSRVILCRNGTTVDLTKVKSILFLKDHKPYIPDEKFRIELAGGWVVNRRLNGVLGVSRAIGDVEYKTLKEMAWKKKFMVDPLSNVIIH